MRERLGSDRAAAAFRASSELGTLAAAAAGEVGGATEAEWASAAGLRSVAELRDLLAAGRRARSTLVSCNMGLAVKAALAARGGAGSGVSLADLVQEGASGLVRATETFDPARRYRFSTYAYSWVRSSIQRALQNEGRTVRIPTWLYEVQSSLLSARAELRMDGITTPSEAQLAARTGLPMERVRAAAAHFGTQLSLDAEQNPRSAGSRTLLLGDTLAGDGAEAAALAERDVEVQRARTDLASLLDTLLERERLVLRAHFGLDGGAPATVAEIAARLGVRHASVAALLASGLSKLRYPQRRALLPSLSDVQ